MCLTVFVFISYFKHYHGLFSMQVIEIKLLYTVEKFQVEMPYRTVVIARNSVRYEN